MTFKEIKTKENSDKKQMMLDIIETKKNENLKAMSIDDFTKLAEGL